jgi:hypothetical protein
MKSILRMFHVSCAILALLGTCSAAESVAAGKVKAVDAAKREFVLTEKSGKDRTIKLDQNVVINRGGQDGQSDLKQNDVVCVYHDANVLVWTATYILVQDGETRNWTLAHGNVKSYDHEKKELTYTDEQGKDSTFSTVDAKAFVNKMESKFESVKIGEHVMALIQKAGDRNILKSIYITRK